MADKSAFENYAADSLRELGHSEAEILGALRGIGKKGFTKILKPPVHFLIPSWDSHRATPSNTDTGESHSSHNLGTNQWQRCMAPALV
jgi:hypothetical protein